MPALVADFRQLRAAFMRDGLFKSSKAWYLWKMASTFALLAGSVTVLLWAARESMLALVRYNFAPSCACCISGKHRSQWPAEVHGLPQNFWDTDFVLTAIFIFHRDPPALAARMNLLSRCEGRLCAASCCSSSHGPDSPQHSA